MSKLETLYLYFNLNFTLDFIWEYFNCTLGTCWAQFQVLVDELGNLAGDRRKPELSQW